MDLDYYVINHQEFKVAYILYNVQNTYLQILPTKTPPGNPIIDTLSLINNIKKEREKF